MINVLSLRFMIHSHLCVYQVSKYIRGCHWLSVLSRDIIIRYQSWKVGYGALWDSCVS